MILQNKGKMVRKDRLLIVKKKFPSIIRRIILIDDDMIGGEVGGCDLENVLEDAIEVSSPIAHCSNDRD
jgi:hypothetical protein